MLSLNSLYLVLFKNACDTSQVANLARQMYPGKSAFMIEALKNAMSAPYGYLLIDLKQETDDKRRLRTGLFPGDDLFVYPLRICQKVIIRAYAVVNYSFHDELSTRTVL